MGSLAEKVQYAKNNEMVEVLLKNDKALVEKIISMCTDDKEISDEDLGILMYKGDAKFYRLNDNITVAKSENSYKIHTGEWITAGGDDDILVPVNGMSISMDRDYESCTYNYRDYDGVHRKNVCSVNVSTNEGRGKITTSSAINGGGMKDYQISDSLESATISDIVSQFLQGPAFENYRKEAAIMENDMAKILALVDREIVPQNKTTILYGNALEEIEALKAENEALKAENEASKAENEALKAENEASKAENEASKAKIFELEAKDKDSEAKISALENTNKGLLGILEGLKNTRVIGWFIKILTKQKLEQLPPPPEVNSTTHKENSFKENLQKHAANKGNEQKTNSSNRQEQPTKPAEYGEYVD